MTASWLFETLGRGSAQPAIVFRDEPLSYADLVERMHFWQGELHRHAVGPGSVVVVEGGYSPNAVGLLLALIHCGAIAVPLTPFSRIHRDKFEQVAEAQLSFEFDEMDRWAVRVQERTVTNPLTRKLIGRGRPGLVLFSSGSSGEPKAVLHDFAALLGKFRYPGVRKTTLTFLLFDHIGGIDTLFGTLANGGTLVNMMNRDPAAVCKAISQHRVHTLPTSPSFLNLLLVSGAWEHHDMSSLRVIAYGTEPMPETVLGRLRAAFPQAKLVQTYGMSELGVLRTRSKDAGSLWMKFSGEGFETKIVNSTLWVRTPTAMLGYLNAPALFDEEGWLNTEDEVEVDGEYVRILGRTTDLVNVGGRKVYPAEVENVLMTMENVRDVSVYGEASPLLGAVLAARINLVKPEAFESFKKRLRTFCRERLPSYKIPVRIELTDREQFGERLKKLRRVPGHESEGRA